MDDTVCRIFGHSMGDFVKPDGSPLPMQINIPIDPETKKAGKIRIGIKCSRCGKLYTTHFWGNSDGKEMEW